MSLQNYVIRGVPNGSRPFIMNAVEVSLVAKMCELAGLVLDAGDDVPPAVRQCVLDIKALHSENVVVS